eukprot:COSAG04_NODE_765_length_10500_cov_7.566869_13_plen_92_part_00
MRRRKQWVTMTEEVEAAGGKVFVFSSMHLSGTQLKNISGVAALLRFPMPEISEEVAVADVGEDSDDDWADSDDEPQPEPEPGYDFDGFDPL